MSRYVELAKDMSTRVAELTKPAQDAYIDAISLVSETVGEFIPALPVPNGVPTVRELVDTSFDLWTESLNAQRAYVGRLFDAVAPITSKFEAQPEAKPAKAASA